MIENLRLRSIIAHPFELMTQFPPELTQVVQEAQGAILCKYEYFFYYLHFFYYLFVFLFLIYIIIVYIIFIIILSSYDN